MRFVWEVGCMRDVKKEEHTLVHVLSKEVGCEGTRDVRFNAGLCGPLVSVGTVGTSCATSGPDPGQSSSPSSASSGLARGS